MLHIILGNVMKEKGLSSHQAAKQIGVSHTTIIRILRKEVVDLKTVINIADWLSLKPSELINSMGSTKTSLGDQISSVLALYPQTRDMFGQTIKAIKDGSADPSVLAEIVNYANYRLKNSQSAHGN